LGGCQPNSRFWVAVSLTASQPEPFLCCARAWGKCLTCPELKYNGYPWEVGVPTSPRCDLDGAILDRCDLSDRDPFLDLVGSVFWILWFMRVLHGGGTDHGCTAPQVRVTCQRSGCTLASATMSSWARVEAAMTITPLPARKCIANIRWAAAASVGPKGSSSCQKGTDYGCARSQNG
jgi:hypothetical protein